MWHCVARTLGRGGLCERGDTYKANGERLEFADADAVLSKRTCVSDPCEWRTQRSPDGATRVNISL